MEIIINGAKTNYQVFGEGKPFLILHGWGSNSDRWVPVAEKISERGFKVIVPDLPGFGKSDALLMPWNTNKYIDWIERFVKELGVPSGSSEFYLLGHSFGGALAAKITIKHAQEVGKLFLVAAACVREKTTKKNFSAKISKVIKLFYFLPYYGLFRKAVYKFIIRKSDYVYVQGIMKETYLNVVAEDLTFQLPFIKVPTVIIWGDKDNDTPIEDGRLINEKIKNSKLIVIPGAGHRLAKENPEILSEKIIENLS
jgi:pimeloyl-ACP methyl ester carboxylesterase